MPFSITQNSLTSVFILLLHERETYIHFCEQKCCDQNSWLMHCWTDLVNEMLWIIHSFCDWICNTSVQACNQATKINLTNYKFKHLHYGPEALKWTELIYKSPQAKKLISQLPCFFEKNDNPQFNTPVKYHKVLNSVASSTQISHTNWANQKS